jgi:hypothetical protein
MENITFLNNPILDIIDYQINYLFQNLINNEKLAIKYYLVKLLELIFYKFNFDNSIANCSSSKVSR